MLNNTMVIRASFNRPNLHYSVRPKPSRNKEAMKMTAKIVKEEFHRKSGIIYVRTISECVELYQYLVTEGLSHSLSYSELRVFISFNFRAIN